MSVTVLPDKLLYQTRCDNVVTMVTLLIDVFRGLTAYRDILIHVKIMAWKVKDIMIKTCYIIIHPRSNINDCLAKTPLNLRHE